MFIPLIRAGVGVTAFFCFMFSWVELLFARTLTVTEAKPIVATMTRTISATGLDWGLLAARHPHHRSGRAGHLVRAQPPGQGVCFGPRLKGNQHEFRMDVLDRSDGDFLSSPFS
jgi:hypothetical protein